MIIVAVLNKNGSAYGVSDVTVCLNRRGGGFAEGKTNSQGEARIDISEMDVESVTVAGKTAKTVQRIYKSGDIVMAVLD